MNFASRKLLHACAVVIAAAAAGTAGAAPVNCANPPDRPEARACEAAAQGVAELRQFIWRKRVVYNLYIHDFAQAVKQ